MNDNYTNWVAFLEGLEAELEQAHIDLDENRTFNPALLEEWSPPMHLEALPLELLERAQTINNALNELQLRAEGRQRELRSEIKRLSTAKQRRNGPRSQYGEQAIPLYFDRKA